MVPAQILDLCTTNRDGSARYRPDQPPDPPPLTQGLDRLRSRRAKHFEQIRGHVTQTLAALKDGTPQRIHERVVASLLGDGPAKATWEPDGPAVIYYACARSMRMAPSHADAALTALHIHEARAAHEHDLGRFR